MSKYSVAVVALLLLAAVAVSAPANASRGGDERSMEFLETPSDSEAAARDVSLIVDETGWSPDVIERSVEFQRGFADRVKSYFEGGSSNVSAVWVEPLPAAAGTIVFVDAIPQSASEHFAGTEVTLRGEGKVSAEEHEARTQLVHESLQASGLDNFSTAYIPSRNAIEIELPQQILARPGEKNRLATAAIAAVADAANGGPGEASLSERARVLDPLELVFLGQEVGWKAMEFAHSRGGAKMFNNNSGPATGFCTSAFTVTGFAGDGILTAAHCLNPTLNRYLPPGTATGYPAAKITGTPGLGGDAAYYTTSHFEPNQFYADAVNVRSVTSVREVSAMVGQAVCIYGRASNQRTCSHTVSATGVMITAEGTTIAQLARVSGQTQIGGDSGGGWSFGNQAWGIECCSTAGVWEYFTPVRVAEPQLSVVVKTS